MSMKNPKKSPVICEGTPRGGVETPGRGVEREGKICGKDTF